MRTALAAAVVMAALISPRLIGQGLEFEVASLKRNTSNNFGSVPPILPSGEVRMTNVPMRTLIAWAYPIELGVPILNLPSWAESERYDLVAKGKPDVSLEERQQMYRALLVQRAKLAAHFETREQQTYTLVMARADRSLGPAIKPSTLNCAEQSQQPFTPPPPGTDLQATAMSRCSFFVSGDTIHSGGSKMSDLARMIYPAAGRPIVDRTGLEGYYAMTFRFQRMPARAAAEPSPDAAPSVFTALTEQLGLKLEPSRTDSQVLVIDHLERPEEN